MISADTPIRRPALRYHGGKWRLASWIIAQFPPHRVYVEPFGGAASVLLRKPRAYGEVYNDLDEDVVNLFTILRDPGLSARLRELCQLTPFSRVEFNTAYGESADPMERARRLLVRSFMGHGSSGVRRHRTGFRSGLWRSHTTPAQDWLGWPNAIPAICARLAGVVIECRPATEVIETHDGPETLLYVDPPHPFATRSQKRKGNDLYHGYRHELSDDGHRALLDQLRGVQGMVVLSSYPSDLHRAALTGWTVRRKASRADRSRPRTEVLWCNRAAKLEARKARAAA